MLWLAENQVIALAFCPHGGKRNISMTKSAFALVEAVTLISDGQIADSVYAEATAVLSDEEIAAIEWLGITINAWNRIATPSRYPVKP
jgi:alkylhydroperoxidase family enzyme